MTSRFFVSRSVTPPSHKEQIGGTPLTPQSRSISFEVAFFELDEHTSLYLKSLPRWRFGLVFPKLTNTSPKRKRGKITAFRALPRGKLNRYNTPSPATAVANSWAGSASSTSSARS